MGNTDRHFDGLGKSVQHLTMDVTHESQIAQSSTVTTQVATGRE